MGGDTYYEILGVPPTATSEEIRVRYRQLILRIHPDVDGPPALFRQVQQAYEVLSDPARRTSYDVELSARVDRIRAYVDPRSFPRGAESNRSSSSTRREEPRKRAIIPSRRHPAAPFALAGVLLFVFGVTFAKLGMVLMLFGLLSLAIAGMAGLGARGTKEWEVYRRSGIAAIDTMTGRQFKALLEHFFASRGYRVARIGGRRADSGLGFLLIDASGRIVVHAERRTKEVQPDVVQEVITEMAHYGAGRALVVTTSSDYSPHAVTVAQAKGVALWNRATLASELTVLSGESLQPAVKRLSSELRSGSRICLGFVTMILLVALTMRTRVRRSDADKQRR